MMTTPTVPDGAVPVAAGPGDPAGGPPAPPGAAGPRFRVRSGRAEVWLVRRPAGVAARALARSELDEAERLRAASFRRPADALLYTAAHVALRRLVGRYTGTAPRDVRFLREPCPGCGLPHGRPSVAPAPPPLHFSLSHSGGLAAVAVAAVPVGVDVQRLPAAEAVDICARALHPDERAELAATRGREERRRHFGDLWTRKESYLKGLGTGLGRSPAEDYLGADTRRHPRGWTLAQVPCDAAHAACVAVRETAPVEVEVHRVPDDWLAAGSAVR
ncbi:4'-phosphopantetheinyl transferase family protein [Streptomyces sp. HMX112]|uniref:4'-phosphopantetheinyl transferase family protein n=1 Tax=Streptomyces sp. HMX112 TaxID=3390850 RepID=UPI003A81280B